MARQHDVAEFLQAQRWKPFEWGVSDCCLFVADWVSQVSGHDPARELRGAYADPMGARNSLYLGGGYKTILRRSGWDETTDPVSGDIAVITAEGRRQMAIHCNGWFWRARKAGLAYQREVETLLVLKCPLQSQL